MLQIAQTPANEERPNWPPDGQSRRVDSSSSSNSGRDTPPDTPAENESAHPSEMILSESQLASSSHDAPPDPVSAPFPALDPTVKTDLRLDTVVEVMVPHFSYMKSIPDIGFYTLLHAALALVISRMVDSEDVCFGIHLVGSQEDVIPFHIRLRQNQTVQSYLNMVRQLEVAFQISSYSPTLTSTCPKRVCMFNTVLHEAHEHGRTDMQTCPVTIPGYPLCFQLFHSDCNEEGISIKARSDQRIMSASAVKRLLRCVTAAIRQLRYISESGRAGTVGTVSILHDDDLADIWGWNGAVPALPNQTAVETIDEWARTRPGAIALVGWDGKLTNKGLASLSHKLAAHLDRTCIGQGDIIALCFEKSVWAVVAMLAVLKTGAGFVMLDPSLAETDLQSIVDQVQAKLVISSSATYDLSIRIGSNVLNFHPDEFSGLDMNDQDRPHPRNPDPSSPAYVSFTFGNSKPIGLSISHENLATAFATQSKYLRLGPDTKHYESIPYQSHISVYLILATLAAGGCLCVPRGVDLASNITESILSLRATQLVTTPAVAASLQPSRLPTIRSVIFFGGGVNSQDVLRWGEQVRVTTAYDRAECPLVVCLNFDPSKRRLSSSIGKGLGVATWVVDPCNHNTLLPPGCVGELVLEGPMLSSGCLSLSKSESKAAFSSFITDPEWLLRGAPGQPGRRGTLLKTGDLVRYDEHGSLQYMGRKDAILSSALGQERRVWLAEVER